MTARPSLSFLSGTLVAFSVVGVLGACTGNLGADDGGSLSGGAPAVGGGSTGGGSTGGGSTGGGSTGGAGVGGSSSGGASSGGSNSGGSGSGGDTGSGGQAGYPPTFAMIRQMVASSLGVSEGCGSGSCHGGEATPHFKDNDELHAALVNPANIADDYCGGLPLITPGDPSKSAIFKAISEGCGTIGYMPRGCDPDPIYGNCLPADAVDAVEAWILAGALAD